MKYYYVFDFWPILPAASVFGKHTDFCKAEIPEQISYNILLRLLPSIQQPIWPAQMLPYSALSTPAYLS